MTPTKGLYADILPDDVKNRVREHRTNWDARFQPSDNLRITTPILEFVMSKQTRADLNAMAPEYRARLEREWAEAAGVTGEPISAELRERARLEWENSDAH